MSAVTSVKLGSRKEALQYLADTYKRPLHSLLLEAVDEYIESRQAQIEYEQRAIQAYEHYQKTGVHLTLDDLKNWADKIRSGNATELPQCHD